MLKLCFLIFAVFFHHFGWAVQKCTMPSGVVVYKQLSSCPSDAVKVEQVDKVPDNLPKIRPAPTVASSTGAGLVVTPIPGRLTKDDVKPDVPDWAALTVCKMAIKRVMKDPERTTIPYVESSTTGVYYRFFWNRTTQLVRAPNAFRSDVGVPVTCFVRKAGGRLAYLAVQEREVFNEDRAR